LSFGFSLFPGVLSGRNPTDTGHQIRTLRQRVFRVITSKTTRIQRLNVRHPLKIYATSISAQVFAVAPLIYDCILKAKYLLRSGDGCKSHFVAVNQRLLKEHHVKLFFSLFVTNERTFRLIFAFLKKIEQNLAVSYATVRGRGKQF
jgi:hypothetical protein